MGHKMEAHVSGERASSGRPALSTPFDDFKSAAVQIWPLAPSDQRQPLDRDDKMYSQAPDQACRGRIGITCTLGCTTPDRNTVSSPALRRRLIDVSLLF